ASRRAASARREEHEGVGRVQEDVASAQVMDMFPDQPAPTGRLPMRRPVGFALLVMFGMLPALVRADDPAPSLRVFYTGHSFHMFVPARVAQMVKAADVKGYQSVGAQSLGGSRVQQHWDLAEEKNQAKKILKKGGADIFTMAPNVKMPDEGIDRFAELALK